MSETRLQVEALKKTAAAMSDWYFKRYQTLGSDNAHDNYLEYRGQETAYQVVLDIMKEHNDE